MEHSQWEEACELNYQNVQRKRQIRRRLNLKKYFGLEKSFFSCYIYAIPKKNRTGRLTAKCDDHFSFYGIPAGVHSKENILFKSY